MSCKEKIYHRIDLRTKIPMILQANCWQTLPPIQSNISRTTDYWFDIYLENIWFEKTFSNLLLLSLRLNSRAKTNRNERTFLPIACIVIAYDLVSRIPKRRRKTKPDFELNAKHIFAYFAHSSRNCDYIGRNDWKKKSHLWLDSVLRAMKSSPKPTVDQRIASQSNQKHILLRFRRNIFWNLLQILFWQ